MTFRDGGTDSKGIHIFGIDDGIDVNAGIGPMYITIRKNTFAQWNSIQFFRRLSPNSRVIIDGNSMTKWSERAYRFTSAEVLGLGVVCSGISFYSRDIPANADISISENTFSEFTCRVADSTYPTAPIFFGDQLGVSQTVIGKGARVAINNNNIQLATTCIRSPTGGVTATQFGSANSKFKPTPKCL